MPSKLTDLLLFVSSLNGVHVNFICLLIALYRIEEGWLFIIIAIKALVYACDKTRV